MKHFFCTTPIYYVNGKPHIGHVYTNVLTDCLARWHSMQNKRIIFSTGTDEHGSKIQTKAKESNCNIQDYCDTMSQQFKTTFDKYNISYSKYIRTSRDETHKRKVQQVWDYIKEEKKDIFMGQYEGWYSVNDESYLTEDQIYKDEEQQIRSKESNHIVEYIKEDNYKFNLNKYVPKIMEWLSNNPSVVYPSQRYSEIVSLIKHFQSRGEGLSVSRPSHRVQWGIPVPNDPSQTIYVWLDALTNYLSVVEDEKEMYWPPQIQVIGKDILKFHLLYWPAFLMALDLPLPEKFIVHSHWTNQGVKMSKSLGNVIDAIEIGETMDFETVRMFLMRESHLPNDSTFSTDKLKDRYHEFADIMGNLLLRIFSTKLHPKIEDAICFHDTQQADLLSLIEMINHLQGRLQTNYEQTFDMRNTIEICLELLIKCNQMFDKLKPWKLEGIERETLLSSIKFVILESIRVASIGLYPIMPKKMKLLNDYLQSSLDFSQLHFQRDRIYRFKEKPPILFPKSNNK